MNNENRTDLSSFVKVAETGSIPDPGRITVEVAGRMVVVFHVEGEFYCIDDVCTHDGGPLGEGLLDDHRVACPRHGALFDIRTGAPLTMPATEATISHEVKVIGNDVLVKITED